MKINFRKFTPFVIVLASLIVFVLMIKLKPEAEFQKPKIIPQVVETVAAYPSQVRAKISSQGTIRPEHEILITSEVAGKVEWISPKFLDGAGFNLGDTLMKIEKRDYELALITTESSLFQAKLALEREQAESKLANIEWKRVGKGDASSLTLREPQLAQARAVLAAAEAAYEQSKRNLRRTVILAPFDGRVRKKMVDIGANLVPGSRIADIYNTLNLEVRLPIADVADVNPRLAADRKPAPNDLVSFVPMSAVSELSVSIEEPVDRPYSEVAKGYTAFQCGDVIVAKITPCFENGKMAFADNLPHQLGFGSTEFHVLRPKEQLCGRYLFQLLS